jgi:hypothetical protein
VVAVVALLLATTPQAAHSTRFGVAIQGGTLGDGIGVGATLTDRWNLRIGATEGSFRAPYQYKGRDYEASAEYQSTYALLDYHPLGGAWRITAGLLANDHGVVTEPTVLAGDFIGGEPVAAGDGGQLTGRLEYDRTAPYLGIGWGLQPKGCSPFLLSFDLGVMHQRSPELTLRRKRGLASVSDEAVSREAAILEDELDDYGLLTAVSVSLMYRF